jgi:hypothetical protein
VLVGTTFVKTHLEARLITLGTHVTDYRIKELGSSFVVVADDREVLICADKTIAIAITTEAQMPTVAFHQRPENFIGPRCPLIHQD